MTRKVQKPNFKRQQMPMKFYQILNEDGLTIKKVWRVSRIMTKGKVAKSSMVMTHSNSSSRVEVSNFTNNKNMFQIFLATQM